MSAIQVPFGNAPHKTELPYDSLQFRNRLRALQCLVENEDCLLFITGLNLQAEVCCLMRVKALMETTTSGLPLL